MTKPEHQTLVDHLRWAANALQALPPTPVTQQVTDVMRDAATAFEAAQEVEPDVLPKHVHDALAKLITDDVFDGTRVWRLER